MAEFSATVDQWVRETKERMDIVLKESVQRLTDEVTKPIPKGGRLPVDTGFLRASFTVTLGSPALTVTSNPGTGSFAYDSSGVSVAISGFDWGQTLYGIFTANYARHQEYGANGRAGRRFVGLAVQNWQQIVNGVVRDLRS